MQAECVGTLTDHIGQTVFADARPTEPVRQATDAIDNVHVPFGDGFQRRRDCLGPRLVDVAGQAALDPRVVAQPGIQRLVGTVVHAEHHVYIEIDQPLLENLGAVALILGEGDPERVEPRDPAIQVLPAVERGTDGASAQERVMDDDNVEALTTDRFGRIKT